MSSDWGQYLIAYMDDFDTDSLKKEVAIISPRGKSGLI